MSNSNPIEVSYPNFTDYRLTKLIIQDPLRCASINEYSQATGIPTDIILEQLHPYVKDSSISFEAVNGEIFVNTSPPKRACNHKHFSFGQNLWEVFRKEKEIKEAKDLFEVYRGLELASWRVEHDSKIVPMNYLGERTSLALNLGRLVIPLLIFPEAKSLDKDNSPLTHFSKTKLSVLAILTKEGSLDNVVSFIRKWYIETASNTQLDILILESPSYTPYILTGKDGSLKPRSATLSYLDNLN